MTTADIKHPFTANKKLNKKFNNNGINHEQVPIT